MKSDTARPIQEHSFLPSHFITPGATATPSEDMALQFTLMRCPQLFRVQRIGTRETKRTQCHTGTVESLRQCSLRGLGLAAIQRQAEGANHAVAGDAIIAGAMIE
jgi:hypothetical protein